MERRSSRAATLHRESIMCVDRSSRALARTRRSRQRSTHRLTMEIWVDRRELIMITTTCSSLVAMADRNTAATNNGPPRPVRLPLFAVIVGVVVICISFLQIKSSLTLGATSKYVEHENTLQVPTNSGRQDEAKDLKNQAQNSPTIQRAPEHVSQAQKTHTALPSSIQSNQSIPEALLPPTFTECCGTHKSQWRSVCLTERACTDPLYPFLTPRDAEYYSKWELNYTDRVKRKAVCQAAREMKPPPTRWCTFEKQPTDIEYPTGCSRMTMADGSGPYDRLLLFPQGKLMFCGIPKAGVTQWLQFLRFTYGAKDYQTIPYDKEDVGFGYFDNMRPHVRQEIWKDPSWTKAIFIRNPAERLLSAYLDKIDGSRKYILRNNVTFEEFVVLIASKNFTKMGSISKSSDGMSTGLSWRTDPHWRPQAWACGLSDSLDTFHYVATMDRADFQKVNLWESFGKHYRVSDTPKGERTARWPPEPLLPGQKAPGFQQQVGKVVDTTGRHNKGSNNKLNKYYTPELMQKVRELYWMDFKLWDALQEADQEGVVHGQDIVGKLNPKCKR